MAYVFEIQGWLADRNMWHPRVMAKPSKEGLRLVAEWWVKKILPKHFTRNAYRIYPGSYFKRKKTGAPMVITGHLRKHIKSHVKITGTSKQSTVHMRYGRPVSLPPKELEKKTRFLMRKNRISFREAQNLAYSNAGYSPAVKAMFREMLTALHPSEKRKMVEIYRDHLVEALVIRAGNSRGKRVRFWPKAA